MIAKNRPLNTPYLGREHFVTYGQSIPHPGLIQARKAFSLLLMRHVFPNDTRQINFEELGLEIARREAVGLGTVPEFARAYPHSGQTVRLQEYAIGTESLSGLLENGTLERCVNNTHGRQGVGLGEHTFSILSGLVKEVG